MICGYRNKQKIDGDNQFVMLFLSSITVIEVSYGAFISVVAPVELLNIQLPELVNNRHKTLQSFISFASSVDIRSCETLSPKACGKRAQMFSIIIFWMRLIF